MECSDVSEGARGQEGNFQPKLLFQAEFHSGTSSTTMLQSPNQRRRMVGWTLQVDSDGSAGVVICCHSDFFFFFSVP